MDAGVLQLHVFPHQRARQSLPLLEDVTSFEPTLTAASDIPKTVPVSLIVPSFRNRSLKQGVLQHLLSGLETSPCLQELILVSSDEEAQSFEVPASVPVTHVQAPPNQRARTRNLGASHAAHDWLLFLDDDMVWRDWRALDSIVAEVESAGYDCALFPRRQYARFPLIYDEGALTETLQDWRGGKTAFDEDTIYDPVRHGCSYATMAFCFPGCFMLIHREAFELLGGFPEEFEGWGFEDSDFALRAAAVLKVLNLFRKSDPFLHLDHPVSPYKSEEYETNYHRFLTAHALGDMERLCDRVLTGNDFLEPIASVEEPHETGALETVLRHTQLPIAGHPVATNEVEKAYRQVMEYRFEKNSDPHPTWVLLHGSRGDGTARPRSDFDLLLLYQGGHLREFFACQGTDATAVEFEFSDCGKFDSISIQPVFHPRYGPLELAKLAQGRLLFGNEEQFQGWITPLLETTLDLGRLHWMLYAAGMLLHPGQKDVIFAERYLQALASLLKRTRVEQFEEDLELLSQFEDDRWQARLRSGLDKQFPGWRDDMAGGRRLFAFQVPEVWTGMRWLLSNE